MKITDFIKRLIENESIFVRLYEHRPVYVEQCPVLEAKWSGKGAVEFPPFTEEIPVKIQWVGVFHPSGEMLFMPIKVERYLEPNTIFYLAFN